MGENGLLLVMFFFTIVTEIPCELLNNQTIELSGLLFLLRPFGQAVSRSDPRRSKQGRRKTVLARYQSRCSLLEVS